MTVLGILARMVHERNKFFIPFASIIAGPNADTIVSSHCVWFRSVYIGICDGIRDGIIEDFHTSKMSPIRDSLWISPRVH